MAIAKGIVDELGGTIFVKSEVGMGTTVIVDLVLLLTKNKNETTDVLEDSSKSIVGMKILFVEKEPLSILVARKLLEQKGAKVYLADNESKALELFENSGDGIFDCILINLGLNGIEGVGTAKKIRRSTRPFSSMIPIIGFGEMLTQEEKHYCVESGINDFLKKPLKFAELFEMVLNLCKNR